MLNGENQSSTMINGIAGPVFQAKDENGKAQYVSPERLTEEQLKQLPNDEREIAIKIREQMKESVIWENGEPTKLPGVLSDKTRQTEIPPIFSNARTVTGQPPIFDSGVGEKAFPDSISILPGDPDFDTCCQIIDNLMNSPNQDLFDISFDGSEPSISLNSGDTRLFSLNHDEAKLNIDGSDLEKLFALTNEPLSQVNSLDLDLT